MKRITILTMAIVFGLLGAAFSQTASRSQARLEKEVRHELVMLPYYGVFDNLAFHVDGSKVTLLGQVTRPTLKNDAEGVVKTIEGVEAGGCRQPDRGASRFAQR
jgi:hyperosmotically inducible protein